MLHLGAASKLAYINFLLRQEFNQKEVKMQEIAARTSKSVHFHVQFVQFLHIHSTEIHMILSYHPPIFLFSCIHL